eukprot:TRINITY_DN5187_c1_g1_i3.p1 TRINITY_DN5187_c1_g1~~TRINITY_DN5187_c1_g1_i3.p1  ORF type:complete len:161 (-),score=15.80 TRINITY_DN5187_c1_g1_i3:142-624(-)
MNVFQYYYNIRCSTCIPPASMTRPSTLKAHSEALDTNRGSPLFCNTPILDDESRKESECAVAKWQLGCSGCNGVTGTRSQGGVKAGWSAGSAGHGAGRCMGPCPYVRMGEECFQGESCTRCHMRHSEDDMTIKLAMSLVLKRKRPVAGARRAERARKLSL